jgi:tRNA(Arg) A34 adenosine deaminase TadA
MRSASRREQTPRRAKTFAIRSSVFESVSGMAWLLQGARGRLQRASDIRHYLFVTNPSEMSTTVSDQMAVALQQAESCGARGEVPVGAALFDSSGKLIAASGNRILELKDPTAHAELLVIRQAARLIGNERLIGTTLTVTLEPCAMCAGAISLARIARLIYGAADPKAGGVVHGARVFDQPTCHHRPKVEGPVGPEACGELLRAFFRMRRGRD